ncbi:hypothetical protein BJ965_007491 [Streptomyces luteogriseus]|uniref:Uncharacterized protein n=1 Tax=Streptomyces luteogriseus TaxID=68233 RepID=A0A7W7DV90_9ACTN|nr:hypothetical protein [Streptomyces luteogriseus]
MLVFQPMPVPWSPRQIHMWSPMTSSLLTTRLVVALPTAAPPTRKYTSCREVGFAAWSAVDPAGPTSIRVCELVVPASKRTPAIFTPSTSATVMAVMPHVETLAERTDGAVAAHGPLLGGGAVAVVELDGGAVHRGGARDVHALSAGPGDLSRGRCGAARGNPARTDEEERCRGGAQHVVQANRSEADVAPQPRRQEDVLVAVAPPRAGFAPSITSPVASTSARRRRTAPTGTRPRRGAGG